MRKKYKFQKEKNDKWRQIVALWEVRSFLVDSIEILNTLVSEELEDIRKALCEVLDKAFDKDKYLVLRDYGFKE